MARPDGRSGVVSKDEMELGRMNRRKFIRASLGAITTAGLTSVLDPLLGQSGELLATDPSDAERRASGTPTGQTPAMPGPTPGRVVEVKHPEVMSGNGPDAAIVRHMIETGMRELTGKDSLGAAWQTFISRDDVVGIKINPLGGIHCFSNHAVVAEIVRGLKAAGVSENNIVIWDRREWRMTAVGYHVNRTSRGVRYLGTERGRVRQTNMDGYDPDVFYHSDVVPRKSPPGPAPVKNSYFSAILTRTITKNINVPVLKDHDSSGATLSLKNLAFGAVNNTGRFHQAPYNCDPMIAELCAHPQIREKTVLHIMDALRGVYNGGPMARPQFAWNCNGLLFSTDPVATDRLCLDVLNDKRTEMGLSSVTDRARHIATAARMGLGTYDSDSIDHVKVNLV